MIPTTADCPLPHSICHSDFVIPFVPSWLRNYNDAQTILARPPPHLPPRRQRRARPARCSTRWPPLTRRAARAIPDAAATPTRFAALYFPNGAFMDNWVPKQTGRRLRTSLLAHAPRSREERSPRPLRPRQTNSRQGDGHYAKTANFLTGFPVAKTTGNDLSVGGHRSTSSPPAGSATRRRCRRWNSPSTRSSAASIQNVGYTRLYGSYISWRSPTCRWPARSTRGRLRTPLRRQRRQRLADRRRPAATTPKPARPGPRRRPLAPPQARPRRPVQARRIPRLGARRRTAPRVPLAARPARVAAPARRPIIPTNPRSPAPRTTKNTCA